MTWDIVIVLSQPNSNPRRSWGDHIIEWNPPPPPHPTQTFKALPGNPGNWFSVCNIILTKLDELWKTTSIFLKMEDDLNFFQMEDDLNFVLGNLGSWFLVCNIVSTQLDEIWKTTSFFKLKTTSIFWKMEDDLSFLTMEDDLKYLKIKDNLHFFKWKRT